MSLALSQNGFLNQQIQLLQPHKGYRVAIDPIMLAASLQLQPHLSIADFGCGVGALTCFLLFREPSLKVVGVENNKEILDLASRNHALNGFAHAFQPIHADIKDLALDSSFDHVISNPPFYSSLAYQQGPSSLKSQAHQETIPLTVWITQMVRHLKVGGTFTMILPPERLPDFFQADVQSLGDLHLFPLWSREHSPAIRMIIRGRKGGKSPLKFLPGLVLHDQNGAYTQEADTILKGGPLNFNA